MIQYIKTWTLRLLIGGLIFLLLLGVGFYFSVNYLVERAIVYEGARATGVEVTLDDASVQFSGTGKLKGLRLRNPENPEFRSEWLMTLDRARATVRPASLMEPVVEIPRLRLDGIHVTIERNNDRENYLVLMNRIKTKLEEAGKADQGGWEFRIRELKLTNVDVTFSGFPGMNRTLKLADIHMKNVGSEKNPLNVTRMTALVFKTVFSQLLTNPEMIPGTVVAGLNEGLRGLEDLGGVTIKFVGNVTDEAGNVLSEVEGAASSAVDEVGGAIEGLFGGDENKTRQETDR